MGAFFSLVYGQSSTHFPGDVSLRDRVTGDLLPRRRAMSARWQQACVSLSPSFARPGPVPESYASIRTRAPRGNGAG